MSPAEFEPVIPARKQTEINNSDRMAIGTGFKTLYLQINIIRLTQGNNRTFILTVGFVCGNQTVISFKTHIMP